MRVLDHHLLLRRIVDGVTWSGLLVGALLFIATLAGSLFAVGLVLVKLPPTYFLDASSHRLWADRHPVFRIAARIAKNAVGAVLVAVGIVLVLPGVPGQGVLTILAGMMLLDLPGKRPLERRIVGRPRVLRAINGLRRRFGQPPFVLGPTMENETTGREV